MGGQGEGRARARTLEWKDMMKVSRRESDRFGYEPCSELRSTIMMSPGFIVTGTASGSHSLMAGNAPSVRAEPSCGPGSSERARPGHGASRHCR